jgi:hypothetical protein
MTHPLFAISKDELIETPIELTGNRLTPYRGLLVGHGVGVGGG